MENENMKLPSRSYWEGFKARNEALWDKVKNNTFVNMVFPVNEVSEGNTEAILPLVVPGGNVAVNTANAIGKRVVSLNARYMKKIAGSDFDLEKLPKLKIRHTEPLLYEMLSLYGTQLDPVFPLPTQEISAISRTADNAKTPMLSMQDRISLEFLRGKFNRDGALATYEYIRKYHPELEEVFDAYRANPESFQAVFTTSYSDKVRPPKRKIGGKINYQKIFK